MHWTRTLARLLLLCFIPWAAYASAFGTVRGIVHDPQHHPIQGAQVKLRAQASEWMQTAQTNAEGEFEFLAVSLGEYRVTVGHPGFNTLEQRVVVQSGSAPVLHFSLSLATVMETVEVSGAPDAVNPESSTTETLVDRRQIERTPGADRTNSLAMITNFVPGAYVVHDQLHIRGGHQVSWLVDGVPVPNTNIADTVGAQFDPKDIDNLEVQRGGYSPEYGDRTYGVFNVVPRTGFERNRQAELVASFGSENETNDQISFGDHTQRFAYYASVNGNRTDLGLQTPTADVIHDQASGFSGFTSLIFNATPADQLRLVASARHDDFQVPNAPDDQAAGIRDIERERDAFANFSWVHTAGPGVLLTLSPFYHFNRAAFDGGPNDTPIVTTDHRTSQYIGGQVSLGVVHGRHNARAGLYGFFQHDDLLFGLRATDGSELALTQKQKPGGQLEAAFVEEQFKLTRWLTLNGGVRLTHFSGGVNENAASPRVGAAIRVPRLDWVVRGFYGRYYQAPPLSTVGGPLLDFALQQGFGFLPLRGERDEQYEVGLAIPVGGWVLDSSLFRTHAHNFFDHNVLGNSNIFLPVTIDTARIRGGEVTLRSPQLWRRLKLHAAYSHQFAEGKGGVTGGLTDFSPPAGGFFFLDHDQRDGLSAGFEMNLPWRSWVTGNLSYGSGFLNGNGPAHLDPHTTFDLSLGKSFGESLSVRLTTLNIANSRYLLDSSNTFGGTHFNYPRQIFATLCYRFHY
jgi:outer membrane receptor for ferrienterochelin and colicin